MATLVLTVVGTALGGPIGASIGAVVGQVIDQNVLFKPKAREGPRLGDLAIQTSSYGTAIPKLFGTMRVAGTVIWSTDLIETRSTSGNGKGQPKSVNYTYSASFAVALSGRRIAAVRRIWADGKLLRGAAGDFKTATGFRVHPGDEDQAPDPLIAAAEGIGEAPAFRGIGYAVFEDFQLADYGNRIPLLTFEVEADAGEVAIGTIAETLGEGAVQAGDTPAVQGYAASGDSVRGAIEALNDAVPLSLIDDGTVLRIQLPGASAQAVARDEEAGRRELVRRAAASVPNETTLTYYDPARDYQAGLQRAVRGPGLRADRRSLAAALSAEGAKAIVEQRLASAWAERITARIELGWRRAGLTPGGIVALEGESGTWRIARSAFGPMKVALDLVRTPPPAPPPNLAVPGRPVLQPDLLHGATLVELVELAWSGGSAGSRPALFALAAGSEPGWRQAQLEVRHGDGGAWQPLGRTAAPAIIGVAETIIADAGSTLFDRRSKVVVRLAHAGMWLEGRSDEALLAGANLALIGEELVQFGTVEALGDRRFRLGSLLRGRRGTEWAAGDHLAGERFVLLETAAMVPLETSDSAIGGSLRVMATGIADAAPAEAARTVTGAAMVPPSPVHLRVREGAEGLDLSWVRRSREGWSWPDGSDTPLAEEQEGYRVIVTGGGAAARIAAVAEPAWRYVAADRAADGRIAPFAIEVVQMGTYGASRPARIIVS